MQRRWVMAAIVASGLLAQTPPPDPKPAPVQVPEPATKPVESPMTPLAEAPKPVQEAKPAAPDAKPASPEAKPASPEVKPASPEAKPFDQLRPTQRKLAYTLRRAALSAHELGFYRSHPRAIEVRDALEALLKARLDIPAKASTSLPAVEAYLAKFNANHGFYDGEGKKILLEGSWKDLQAAARAAAKTGPKGLEPRLAKVKGLLFDAKVDATALSWAEPDAPAKGKKAKAAKGPKAPEGFANQKAILALWVKRAQSWIDNTRQEVDVKGEKKLRSMPDPAQTKALNALLIWLENEDLDLLRDPAFGWLDLRRLGAMPGAALLAHADAISTSKAPEGPAGELALLPALEPVMGESKFAKGDEKRAVLIDAKQGAPAANLAEQCAAFEPLARSRDFEVK